MTAQHTPTPWMMTETQDQAGGAQVSSRPDGFGNIATCWLSNADANAAFIVRAANSHEALVDAIDVDTLEAIAEEIDSFQHSARADGLRRIAGRQRAALAAAGQP